MFKAIKNVVINGTRHQRGEVYKLDDETAKKYGKYFEALKVAKVKEPTKEVETPTEEAPKTEKKAKAKRK